MTDFYKEYLKASVIGIEMTLCILFGAGLGYVAERYWQAPKPWGLIFGTALGVAASGRTLYRFVKKYLKNLG